MSKNELETVKRSKTDSLAGKQKSSTKKIKVLSEGETM